MAIRKATALPDTSPLYVNVRGGSIESGKNLVANRVVGQPKGTGFPPTMGRWVRIPEGLNPGAVAPGRLRRWAQAKRRGSNYVL